MLHSLRQGLIAQLVKSEEPASSEQVHVEKANPNGINQYTKGKGGGSDEGLSDGGSFEGRTSAHRQAAFANSPGGKKLNSGLSQIASDTGVEIDFPNQVPGSKKASPTPTSVGGTIRTKDAAKAEKAKAKVESLLKDSGFTPDGTGSGISYFFHEKGYRANIRTTSSGDVDVSVTALDSYKGKAKKTELPSIFKL